MSDLKGENTGLFAKVLKFVRSPSTTWAGLDAPEEAPESGYSKQMLKEMIERKRRNDFVRRREFDMLRKLRRSEVIAGHDPAGRPSFFQSSLPSRPDDRASTLKKIDEIEAQMSQQWWKTRNGEPTSGGLATTGSSGLATRAAVLASDVQVPAPDVLSFDAGIGSTRTSAVPTTMAASLPATLPISESNLAWLTAEPEGASGLPDSGFSISKAIAVDVEEFAHDPELEDVAIRFAHGDDAGAESGLRALLIPGGGREAHEETWLVLFDLYRAMGQQDRFDDAAVEFARRFGRSAPQWLSLPELARGGGQAPPSLPAAPAARSADWTCPATLTAQGVQSMQASLARVAGPWRLAWSRLQRIEDGALEPLTRLMGQWAGEAVRLQFVGAEALQAQLQRQTVSGQRDQPMGAWQLRMAAARLMNRPDEFETVALDYCITYEVSPPSWEQPRCQFKALADDGTDLVLHSLPGEGADFLLSSVPASGFGETSAPVSRLAPLLRGELAGSLQGDASAILDRMPVAMPGEPLLISCARLVRVDFGAAGSLLNWCTARQGEGCLLQLTDVHRLIATFFTVVGISGCARITLRRD